MSVFTSTYNAMLFARLYAARTRLVLLGVATSVVRCNRGSNSILFILGSKRAFLLIFANIYTYDHIVESVFLDSTYFLILLYSDITQSHAIFNAL